MADKKQLRILYWATIVIGLIATGVGISIIGVISVLDLWWKLSGIFAGGMLGIFSLSMIARHFKPSVPVIAVITGTLVIIWMTFSKSSFLPEGLRNPLHTNMTIVVGALSIYLVGSLLGKLGGSTKFEVHP